MFGKKMKNGKNAVKKTAVILAAAVMCTAVSAGGLQKAAAASKVSMAASKNLMVGQSYKLKLKNAAGWVVQSAKTSNKKIVKIAKRTKKAVTVSAVRAGWCSVTVRAKHSGSGKTKKLKCRIKVIAGVKREVSTQAQLKTALNKKDTAQITINNTTQETSYNIPAGTYSNIALIVKAGSADVTNNGAFRSVTIQGAEEGGSWTENAKGNSLQVTSTVSKIVVNDGAKVSNISVEKAGADTHLELKGSVSKVTVSGANAKLSLSGSPAAVVPIVIKKAAEGAEVTTSVRVNATVKAKKAQITLNKGAEESTIKAITVKTKVVNNTDGKVTVTDANGTADLDPGKEMTTTDTSGASDNVELIDGKNAVEVKILQNIIKEQNAAGANLPEHLNLNDGYYWYNGHVKKIDWAKHGLTGELDVSGLTSLENLNCENNQLTGLDVSGLTSLKNLYCYSNQLTGLDVSSLTSLEILDCDNNQLTRLDVSGLTSLWLLDCVSNQLTGLNVNGLTSLKSLDCRDNQLTGLDVSSLTFLELLDCDNNQLTGLDVSGLTSLKGLDCDNNQLTGLDVSGLTSLKILNCNNNQLTGLDVSGLTSLKILTCRNNQLTGLDVNGLTFLELVLCDDNVIVTGRP